MIELRNVTKEYGKRKALQDVSLQFEKGKIYGILGPNGSGKSTMMKMAAGLVFPSKGEVIVNGQPADRSIARDVAYLSSEGMVYPGLTVQQMIEFFAAQHKDFSLEKAEELIQFMSLERHKKVAKMSKGQQGRLKLLLVLSRKAPVLLLDEPFLGLDPMVRDTIVKGLVSFIDFGEQTVIITTHEITEIEPVLEEAVILDEGMVRARCHVEALREEEGLSVLQWLKRNYQ
ncbi:ATP-binding cassette domain-containing protein [Bacillus badius]|uniref:ABC transporter, ATP-binding protein n=1 Tax=Bacillus badius TaxID=1455 RepID=A0ABR5ATR8_BACBA|nr:ABC transporter ATP-binding protein [Bacillus badius]KIL75422.1 ABC transporter, ATP-binding protein [Bacillus badius]KIL78015.1 ABC transporter, ATP-binding protein [Bacillus badius]KZR58422.1 spermidine/putrescine ABC transporter ATP-binding protein [Bacillus badius]MED4716442.1 ABC transporter ATP-binding protein [Bacillus badius]